MNIFDKIFNRKVLTDVEVIDYLKEEYENYEKYLEGWDFIIIDKTHLDYEDIMTNLYEVKLEGIINIIDDTVFKYLPYKVKYLTAKLVEFLGFGFDKIALTSAKEKTGQDLIWFIVDNFKKHIKKYDVKDWKSLLKRILNHEVRHVMQFKELRKKGDYVAKALDLTNIIGYYESPIEIDAYENEDKCTDEQSSIKEAVDNIIKTIEEVYGKK